jgi:NAD(P)-dependent dehydrogenase (short-subunit alcohol dehydrogenase family)
LKTAIITGAGGGIGRRIAIALAGAGFQPVCTDIDEARGRETARLANGCFRRLDVSNSGEALNVVNAVIEEFRGIDLLVNNAGAIHFGAVTDTSDKQWRRVLDVNLTGAFNLSRAAIPCLIQTRGKIINIASWTGKTGRPNLAAYSASKFGLIGLTQSMALELAPSGVTVNAICPGTIDQTEMGQESDAWVSSKGLPTARERADGIPMGRLGTPEDIAHAAVFLASPSADYITGHALDVSGGMLMR